VAVGGHGDGFRGRMNVMHKTRGTWRRRLGRGAHAYAARAYNRVYAADRSHEMPAGARPTDTTRTRWLRFKSPLVLVVVAGCATNPTVLGFAYGRVDDRLAGNFEDFADFDAEQTAFIRDRMRAWQAWHRRTQLPQYARFLTRVGERVAEGAPTRDEARQFATELEALYGAVAACHPLEDLAPFLAHVSDAQVAQMAAHFEKRRRDRETRTVDDRIERTVSGLERLGFTFDAPAIAMVADHYARVPDISALRHAAVDDWSDTFLALLRTRHEPGFDARIDAHMARALGLTRRAHPDAVEANLTSWTTLVHDLIAAYDDAQRADLAERLIALGSAIATVAADREPVAIGPPRAPQCTTDSTVVRPPAADA